MKIERGDVWWVDMPFLVEDRQSIKSKTRPCVVVSAGITNTATCRVQVIPFSSQVGKVYYCECLIEVEGGKSSKAMADQLQTVHKNKLLTFIRKLDRQEMQEVDSVMREQLEL